jgi:hypothetical protein
MAEPEETYVRRLEGALILLDTRMTDEQRRAVADDLPLLGAHLLSLELRDTDIEAMERAWRHP